MDNAVPSKRELVQAIVRGIKQDTESYKQLKKLLNRQRELMQCRDNRGLNLHNKLQSSLCEDLMYKADLRRQMLESLGFAGNASGMQSLINKMPPASAGQVTLLWQNLLITVKESQQVNEANGKLLVAQQEVISQLLHPGGDNKFDYGAMRTL
ncbi:flagellar export chaperone FlgN [Shewanella sp. 10N.261.52.F9]|uniref:flagellar export chaperone FlgN n=1 Tax=Shewanella TaxID=22 RepID=UPI00200BAB2C|nr:flagellar export chaperone FlgN [Shewanella marinintestina]MCL1147733.1 flagellar protein FlgN [Shewanella marinintestina]